MPNEVLITIRGNSEPLQKALADANKSLQGFSTSTKTASRDAASFGTRLEITGKLLGTFGAESTETVLKVQGLGAAFREARESLGGFGAAIRATAGSFLLFAGLDFLKDSAQEAMNAQGAWDRLTASYQGNAEGLERVKASIEDNRTAWEQLGITQGQVATMAVTARQRGMDPASVLNPQGLLAVSRILHTDIAGALDAISRPRGTQQVLSRLGLSALQIRQSTQEMRTLNAAGRATYLEGLALRTPGAGLMPTDAQSRFAAFRAAMSDLKEEVGTALIPALTALATAMTNILQGADKAAKPFGGLANVLKVMLIPMLLLGFALFTNMFGVINRLVGALLGRLVGAFTQTAEAAAEAAAAIRDIPPDVTTVAEFIPATAIKDAYIANVLSVPKVAQTTAVFDEAGAMAGVGAFRLAMAAGVGLAVTIGTFALASGALRPVTDAIGNLVGTIGSFVWGGIRTVGDAIGDWFKNLTVGIGMIGRWLRIPQIANQTVRVIGHFIADHKSLQIMKSFFQGVWDNTFGLLFSGKAKPAAITVHVDARLAQTLHINKIVIDKGTNIPTVTTGEVVHVKADVLPGAASAAQLHTAKLEITPDQVIIDKPTGQTILPRGTELIVDAKGRVLELIGKDGKPYHPTIPVTLSGTDIGALGPAIATAIRNAHITGLADPSKPQHVVIDNKPTVQIGNWWGMLLPSLLATFAGTLASGLVLQFGGKLLGPLWDIIKGLFSRIRGGGGKGGKGGGFTGFDVDTPIEAYEIPDYLKKAFPGGVPSGIPPTQPYTGPPLTSTGHTLLDISKMTFTALSTIPVLLDMTKVKFNPQLPPMPSFNIDWGLVLKGAFVTLGAAIVAGFLATVVPLAVTAAIDVGTVLVSGIMEGATAGLATPLVAILLGTVGAASIAAYTGVFHKMGSEGDKAANDLKNQHGGIFGDLLGNIGNTFRDAFSKTSSALGSIGGTIINFIVSGVKGAWKTIQGIGSTIIDNIKTAVMSGVVNLVNGIIGFFNTVFKTLANTPIVGKAFEKVRIPTLPVPPPTLRAATLSTSAGAGAATVQPSYVTANFTIHNATDPDLVARTINRHLTDMLSGVKSSERLWG